MTTSYGHLVEAAAACDEDQRDPKPDVSTDCFRQLEGLHGDVLRKKIEYIQQLASSASCRKVWHELRKLASDLAVRSKSELTFTVISNTKQPGHVTVSCDGALGVPGWLVPDPNEVE